MYEGHWYTCCTDEESEATHLSVQAASRPPARTLSHYLPKSCRIGTKRCMRSYQETEDYQLGHDGCGASWVHGFWQNARHLFKPTARCIDSLLRCGQKRKTRVDVGLCFLTTLRYNLKMACRGTARRSWSVWSRVPLWSNYKPPSTWVESAIMEQEECDAAGCQPGEPATGQRDYSASLWKWQCLLLKYDQELKGHVWIINICMPLMSGQRSCKG